MQMRVLLFVLNFTRRLKKLPMKELLFSSPLPSSGFPAALWRLCLLNYGVIFAAYIIVLVFSKKSPSEERWTLWAVLCAGILVGLTWLLLSASMGERWAVWCIAAGGAAYFILLAVDEPFFDRHVVAVHVVLIIYLLAWGWRSWRQVCRSYMTTQTRRIFG